MAKIRQHTEYNKNYHLKYLTITQRLEEVCEELGILDHEGTATSYNDEIEVECTSLEEAKELISGLLMKVGKFAKTFNEATGKLALIGNYKDFNIKLSYAPPNDCKIERIETEEDVPAVPAQPATKRKVVKYIATGNCLPILKDGE